MTPSLGTIFSSSFHHVMLATVVAATFAGCKRHEVVSTPAPVVPDVRVIHPSTRTITRVVGQPSFIESYERTAVYPKMSAYIEKWNVDIGDILKKNQVMATLFVPEMVEDFGTKRATVELDKQKIDQAKKLVAVAEADVKAAQAELTETKSLLEKEQAEVDRWDSEVKRLKREVDKGVVDPQVLLESTNQYKSSLASRNATVATIDRAAAQLQSQEASLAKAVVDVGVAEANLSVAESEARRLEAWVGYLKLLAPYDGIVVARNANTGDFVLPATGDPTADRQAPDLSPNGKAAPIYVVDRTDVVRVFVDIPERDANYVRSGAKAKVLVEAFSDEEIDAIVVRTSWALNVTSRTLRAEIDLLNTGSKIPNDLPESIRKALEGVTLPKTTSQLLPGMYAYGKVTIEREGVLAIPMRLLVLNNGKTFVWRVVDGKAARFEVQTGADDGQWIELRKQRPAVSASGSTDEHPWMPWDGSEQVIASDVARLIDGEPLHTTTADADSKNANAPVR